MSHDDRYAKGKGEDYSVMLTLRITPSMDNAIDTYLNKGGKFTYDNKQAFIRDGVYKLLLAVSTQGSGVATIIGGLKLLNMAANDELIEQEVLSTIESIERSLSFYIAENAPKKVAECLDKYAGIINGIEGEFWKGYLQEKLRASKVYQDAVSIVAKWVSTQGVGSGGNGQVP